MHNALYGADYTRLVTAWGGDRPARVAEEGRGARSGGDGRRKRASSTKTSRWPHATTRGPEQFTRATCAARAIPTIFVLHIRKGKGSFSLSLACRRLEGERTIAGAERRRQLRSMMLFLGFWNSLAPTTALSAFLVASPAFPSLFSRRYLPALFAGLGIALHIHRLSALLRIGSS